MIFKKFLEDETHAFSIATIAIIFQSVLTACIGIFLVAYLTGILSSLLILTWLLYIDVAFVLLHLAYRGLYRGPKVLLKHHEKKILLAHILSSLIALFMTFYFMYNGAEGSHFVIYLILLVWGLSLLSGVIFFKRKYVSEIIGLR